MLVFENSGSTPNLRLTFEVHIHVYHLSLPTLVPLQCSPSLSFQDFASVVEFSILLQLFPISFLVMENFDCDPFLSKNITLTGPNLLFPCVSCSNPDSCVAKVYFMYFAVSISVSSSSLLSRFIIFSTSVNHKEGKNR